MYRKYHNVQLILTNTTLAKAYGLPKIHKKEYPLRPIIYSLNSPTHFLGQTLYNDLKNSIKKPISHVDNSFDLVNKIKNIIIPDEYIMLSLDVCSLLTNIPNDLVCKSFDRRWTDIHRKCKIPFDEIVNITNFLFDNTYCVFRRVGARTSYLRSARKNVISQLGA